MIRGLVRGNTIELEDETGLPDGQEVAVTLHPIASGKQTPMACEGLQRAFGGWDDNLAGLDEFLQWNHRQRKFSRSESQP